MRHSPRFTLADILKLLAFAVSEVPEAVSASLVVNVGDDVPRMTIPLPIRPPAEPVSSEDTISDC